MRGCALRKVVRNLAHKKTGKPGSRTPAPPFTDPATSADRLVSGGLVDGRKNRAPRETQGRRVKKLPLSDHVGHRHRQRLEVRKLTSPTIPVSIMPAGQGRGNFSLALDGLELKQCFEQAAASLSHCF